MKVYAQLLFILVLALAIIGIFRSRNGKVEEESSNENISTAEEKHSSSQASSFPRNISTQVGFSGKSAPVNSDSEQSGIVKSPLGKPQRDAASVDPQQRVDPLPQTATDETRYIYGNSLILKSVPPDEEEVQKVAPGARVDKYLVEVPEGTPSIPFDEVQANCEILSTVHVPLILHVSGSGIPTEVLPFVPIPGSVAQGTLDAITQTCTFSAEGAKSGFMTLFKPKQLLKGFKYSTTN